MGWTETEGVSKRQNLFQNGVFPCVFMVLRCFTITYSALINQRIKRDKRQWRWWSRQAPCAVSDRPVVLARDRRRGSLCLSAASGFKARWARWRGLVVCGCHKVAERRCAGCCVALGARPLLRLTCARMCAAGGGTLQPCTGCIAMYKLLIMFRYALGA